MICLPDSLRKGCICNTILHNLPNVLPHIANKVGGGGEEEKQRKTAYHLRRSDRIQVRSGTNLSDEYRICTHHERHEHLSKMAMRENSSELPNLKIEIENDLDEAMEIDNENNAENKISKEDGPEEGELSDSKENDTEVKTSVFGIAMSTSNIPTWVTYIIILHIISNGL
jgi:hypothetical protein